MTERTRCRKLRLAYKHCNCPDRTTRPPLPNWLRPGRNLVGYSLKCSYVYWSKLYWATPPWLTPEMIDEIEDIYESAKEGEHVDHMVPLKGDTVSGLHVPWNLEPINDKENMQKGNKWWPDMWNEQLELDYGT